MISSIYIRKVIATRGPRAARYEIRKAWSEAGSQTWTKNERAEYWGGSGWWDDREFLVKWLVDDYLRAREDTK